MNIVEAWLREVVRKLPPEFRLEVNTFLDDGEFISFAASRGDGGTISWNELVTEARESMLGQKGRGSSEQEELKLEENSRGYHPLREWLSKVYAETEGGLGEAQNNPDQLLLVEDAGEALSLLFRSLMKPGDVVLVETPASPEALALLSYYGATVVHVACDGDGMLLKDLRKQISVHKPVLLYVTPHYSNPSGSVWSLERKVSLLEICEGNELNIIEDNTVGVSPLIFSQGVSGKKVKGTTTQSLYELQQTHEGGIGRQVIGVGSFEGTIFPALPLAWIRGERQWIRSLLDESLIEPTSQEFFDRQRILHTLLEFPSFSWREHAVKVQNEYAARRRLTLELMSEPAWEGTGVSDPGGGLFLWVRLPKGLCPEALLRATLLEGVAFVPGGRCYAGEPDSNAIRLTFAAHGEARLRQGMAVIGEAITAFTARAAD